ncbi:unnamed protein product [Prorocentrum cordatum]|uniref:ANK_REP_REGION domain-containing protein n=1 Tax=Prorocentrum cordatum TaxID=2364126 RepID=A0ABN9RDJ3_9DINO|nr:unnamed protein product [Polarella glacialis]
MEIDAVFGIDWNLSAREAITKVKGQAHEDKVDKTPALAAGGDEEMAAAPAAAAQDAATNQAGAKLVSFLSRAKTVNKLQAALQQILNRKQEPAALGAALVHCAGRGNGSCVSALLEAGAPVDARAPAAEGGHTALQLAASRGHVAACSTDSARS